MTETLPGLANRVAYLVHRGCVEIRSLAYAEAPHAQIAELADALELLPQYIRDDLSDDDWKMVRYVIENYHRQYPESGWRLVQSLDRDPIKWYGP